MGRKRDSQKEDNKLTAWRKIKGPKAIYLLSLFCSRMARISLQYSLLASNGIFA